MLTGVPVTEQMADFGKMVQLYERAFPANERRPLTPLLHDSTGCADVMAFYAGEEFIGFACLLSWKDMTHILYIAMEENARGKGYGTEALALIQKKYEGRRILADLEAVSDGVNNHDQRRQRMRFYLKNGYEQTEVAYRWRGEDYVILSQGGPVTDADFHAFWHYFECENTAFAQF